MLKLFYPLYREALKIHAWLLASGLVGIVAARVFGVTELGAAMYALPLIVMFLIFPIVGGNLNWVLSLPLSKNQIMLQTFFWNLLNFVVCLVNISVLAGTHYLLLNHALDLGSDSDFWKELYDSSPGDLAFWLFCLLFGYTLLFPHSAIQGIVAPKKAKSSKFTVKGIGVLVALAFVTPLALSHRILNPMLFCAVLLLVFPLGSMLNTMRVMGFPARYRCFWLGSTLIACLLGISLVCAKAFHRLRDGESAAVRYHASSFLGAFTGELDNRKALEDFLREDLPERELDEVIRSYGRHVHRSYFFNKENWLDQRGSPVTFRELLTRKTDRGAIRLLSELFDPRGMTKEDLAAYFDKVALLKDEGKDGIPGSFWAYLNLSQEEVLGLLESGERDRILVGLAYARYHAKPGYFAAIQKLLPEALPEPLILSALQTLATQSETKATMRDFASISRGRAKFGFREFSCEKFDPQGTDDPVELNYCIRRLSLALPYAALAAVEPYLFTLPLKDKQKRAVEGWLKHRNDAIQ